MEVTGKNNVRPLRDTPYSSCGTRTDAVRWILKETADPAVIADLLFLEAWESGTMPSIAASMRAAQIRRGNPELAAQIRNETQQLRAASSGHTAALSAASLRFPSIPEDNDDRPDLKADHPEVNRNPKSPGVAQHPPGIGPSSEFS